MPPVAPNPSPRQNPFLLAADNSPDLLPLLRADPTVAARQDEAGYSLLHAAASYNNLDLARSLKSEFRIDPNIKDEDGETALFVVESVEAAQCLLEDLGADLNLKNAEGLTAEEKIRGEGDFVVVADYLKEARLKGNHSAVNGNDVAGNDGPDGVADNEHLPPLPPGIQLRVGQLEDEHNLGEVADPELRRRIEELAAREDFQSGDGQQQLRELITDAVRGVNEGERDVRRRVE